MFKQKPKYDQPDAQVRWFVADRVITTSSVSFDTATTEAFSTDDDEFIDF